MSEEERDNWVEKFTGMKLDIVKNVTLPVFSTQYNIPSLQQNLELAVKHKLVSKPFDVNAMIYKP